MNRRNFVVGLGTVATISGVASVTSAAFTSDVQATTNFQIVPDDAQLVVRRLQKDVDYSNLSNNASWNDSEIGDFGNVTGTEGSKAVAYVNESENGNLGAQLAFNNTNSSAGNETIGLYQDNDGGISGGEYGFFEIANLGNTNEDVGITFGYSDRVTTDEVLTESQVADMFTFEINGKDVSPTASNTSAPNDSATIQSGNVAVVELTIKISDTMYQDIQSAAGGAFSNTESSIKLLDTVTVGTDF